MAGFLRCKPSQDSDAFWCNFNTTTPPPPQKKVIRLGPIVPILASWIPDQYGSNPRKIPPHGPPFNMKGSRSQRRKWSWKIKHLRSLQKLKRWFLDQGHMLDQRQNSSFERNSEDEVNKSKITLLEAILPSIQHDIKTKGAETEKWLLNQIHQIITRSYLSKWL